MRFLTPLTCVLLPALVAAVDEAVSFPSRDGFRLEGTLRLPSSASSANPVPGVLLIHGSGIVNRDELLEAFGHPISVFAEIGDALRDKGIAVLTYDKRICSSFNDCYKNSYPKMSEFDVNIDVLIEDSLAAVHYMKSRSEIDGIVAVGHSQAGTYIPIMLESEPEVITKGVMVAGSFRPWEEQAIWMQDFYIDLMDIFGLNVSSCVPSLAQVVELRPQLMQWWSAIKNGIEVPDYPGLEPAKYWKVLFDVHNKSMSVVANINQPLLVLQGDMDWTVPPSDAKDWSEYLEQVGADYDTKILPCVTHLLNCIKNFPYNIGTEVDPQIKDSLIDFVLGDGGDTSKDVLANNGGSTSGVVIPIVWRPTLKILLAIATLLGLF